MLSNINQSGILRNDFAVSCREILFPAAICTQVHPAGQLPGHHMALALVCKYSTRQYPSWCIVRTDAFSYGQLRPHPVGVAPLLNDPLLPPQAFASP